MEETGVDLVETGMVPVIMAVVMDMDQEMVMFITILTDVNLNTIIDVVDVEDMTMVDVVNISETVCTVLENFFEMERQRVK